MSVRSRVSARSLSRRIVIWTGAALLVLLVSVEWIGNRILRGRVLRQADAAVVQASEQAASVIDAVILAREHEVRLLASLPSVVDAARTGADRAVKLGLVGLPLAGAEARFDSTRTLDIDPRTRRFLIQSGATLDLAEVLVTDLNGYNVITTERTSDFVQSDEGWWQQAFTKGLSPAVAAYDESAGQVSLSVSAAVRDAENVAPVGVMKVVYGLSALQTAVSNASTSGSVTVDLIDESGRVVASSEHRADLKPLAGHEQLPKTTEEKVIRYEGRIPERASVHGTNNSAWRVIARMPESLVTADINSARTLLGLAGLGALVLLVGALAAINGFMTRRIARPAASLAAAAEAVAAGNLSVKVEESAADDEIGRLGRATSRMLGGLRGLTLAITSSAKDTASMAQDLTASSEEISASSQQMAQMASDLSQQSADMAQTIQEMAGDSVRMAGLSGDLTSGASDGVQRNQRLKSLATENRNRLDANARRLEALVAEVQESVRAATALTAASEEIREFVILVQRMASQSKLLAFSAGMEASRAGQEGAGFAVVAKEVQRLADSSAEAAERTEKVVSELLARVAETRASSTRSATAMASVRESTQQGLDAFKLVETAVAESEAWTATIEQAAQTSKLVVDHTRLRLDALARGTETFAAAMEEVAASAEEQSASTEEIVSTATAMSASAERLAEQAGAFRLNG